MLANHHAPASNDSPQGDSDYEIILTALMESARGRSFLEEYAKRNRATDTATLLTAIGRIEGLLTSRSLEPAAPEADVAPSDKTEPLGANAGQPQPAAETLDVDVFEAAPVAIENVPPETAEQDGLGAAEILDVEIVSPKATPVQVRAIEFLGPEITRTELQGEPDPAKVSGNKPSGDKAAPPTETIHRQAHDPFADIRALSDHEKIALFA